MKQLTTDDITTKNTKNTKTSVTTNSLVFFVPFVVETTTLCNLSCFSWPFGCGYAALGYPCRRLDIAIDHTDDEA
jgi:hypothetical protein